MSWWSPASNLKGDVLPPPPANDPFDGKQNAPITPFSSVLVKPAEPSDSSTYLPNNNSVDRFGRIDSAEEALQKARAKLQASSAATEEKAAVENAFHDQSARADAFKDNAYGSTAASTPVFATPSENCKFDFDELYNSTEGVRLANSIDEMNNGVWNIELVNLGNQILGKLNFIKGDNAEYQKITQKECQDCENDDYASFTLNGGVHQGVQIIRFINNGEHKTLMKMNDNKIYLLNENAVDITTRFYTNDSAFPGQNPMLLTSSKICYNIVVDSPTSVPAEKGPDTGISASAKAADTFAALDDSKRVEKIEMDLYKYNVAGEPILKLNIKQYTPDVEMERHNVDGIVIDSTSSTSDIHAKVIANKILDDDTVTRFKNAYTKTRSLWERKAPSFLRTSSMKNTDIIRELRKLADTKPEKEAYIVEFINFINTKPNWKNELFNVDGFDRVGSQALNVLMGTPIALESIADNTGKEAKIKQIIDSVYAVGKSIMLNVSNVIMNNDGLSLTFTGVSSLQENQFKDLLEDFFKKLQRLTLEKLDIVIKNDTKGKTSSVFKTQYDRTMQGFTTSGTFGYNKKSISTLEFSDQLFNALMKKSFFGGKSRRARKYKTKRCMKGGRKTRKHRRRRHTMKM
jgi:hypothetical protein